MRLLFCLLLAGTLAATAAALNPTHIPEFAMVDSTLYRGGQASHEDFVALRQMGIKTIVDLRFEQNDLHLIRGMGFRYVHLNEIADIWKPRNVAAFLSIVSNPDNAPVFVHCNTGQDRTGEMVAAYRVVLQGWTPGQAVQEALQYHYRTHFANVLHQMQHLDPQVLRQAMAAEPAPTVSQP